MNQVRRKAVAMLMEKINHVCAELEDVRDDLDVLRDEEYDSYASYPENLQESERATSCLDNSEKFGEMYDTFADFIDEFNGYLEDLSDM